MTEVPKIVHQRLRAAEAGRQTAEGAHPEADVLAAFAEQALSPRERDGVLDHLALCADCREVVALTLPAAELTPAAVEQTAQAMGAPVSIAARWGGFAWANLRWAALAAGIAVALLVGRQGFEHRGKPEPSFRTAGTQTASPAAPAPPSSQSASGTAREYAAQFEAREGEVSQARTKQERSAVMAKAEPSPAPLRESEARTFVADSTTAAKVAPTPPAALAFEPPNVTNQTIEVSGASASGVETTASALDKGIQTTPPSFDSSVAARNVMPIEKAKPPLEEAGEEKKTAAASAQAQMKAPTISQTLVARAAAPFVMGVKPNATWMIKAGLLQRSLDGGQSWQTAVKADHALLCYASRGQEIWAGGRAGTLLQSTDGGTTWSAIKASYKGQSLDADVTRIDLRQDTADIVLATATHQTWSSPDGGKTWEKK